MVSTNTSIYDINFVFLWKWSKIFYKQFKNCTLPTCSSYIVAHKTFKNCVCNYNASVQTICIYVGLYCIRLNAVIVWWVSNNYTALTLLLSTFERHWYFLNMLC